MSKSERQDSDSGLSQETTAKLNASVFAISPQSQKDYMSGQAQSRVEANKAKAGEDWLSSISLTSPSDETEGGLKIKQSAEAKADIKETPLNLPVYNLVPENFRLPPMVENEQATDGFRLKPLSAEAAKLNLDLPTSFLQTENYRLNNFAFAPEFKPIRRDLREVLDRAVTFELNLGGLPLEMSLNTRKCGMRSRPGLCFRKKLD